MSLGSSSPKSSEGWNADETGWKLGAWGSVGGAVLQCQNCEDRRGQRARGTHEKNEENMVVAERD